MEPSTATVKYEPGCDVRVSVVTTCARVLNCGAELAAQRLSVMIMMEFAC